jgi:hypothetical protein
MVLASFIIASEAAPLVKVELFSKSIGEIVYSGRNWLRPRFLASPPKCKPK